MTNNNSEPMAASIAAHGGEFDRASPIRRRGANACTAGDFSFSMTISPERKML